MEVARSEIARAEQLGFSSVWVGEAFRREIFTNAALLLASTSSLVVATGIANIWARDAQAMRSGQLTLAEAFPDRFLLGLGVSHVPLVNSRGHHYQRPYTAMREYLAAMATARFQAVLPANQPPTVLAALGPRMLELARDQADGAHPYFVPVAHTQLARRVLGPGKLLCPEQAVVLDEDPTTARATARKHTQTYLRLPNYVNNLRRLGFGEDDLEGGGSDRLVDAVVAWGSLDTIEARVGQHLDAGADHVALQVIQADPAEPPGRSWRRLAQLLPTFPD